MQDGGDISLLVAKHVKQMELTENKWKADLEATRKKQKRAYRCCIRRWASQGLPDKLKADILGEFKIALKKTECIPPSSCSSFLFINASAQAGQSLLYTHTLTPPSSLLAFEETDIEAKSKLPWKGGNDEEERLVG